jgi:ribosome biogenesis GTPase
MTKLRGIVVRNTGSLYEVKTDEGQLVPCRVKGNFRLRGIRSTNPVAVGDCVVLTDSGGDVAYIVEIEERRNYIIRKASNLSKQSHILAANLDLAVLMVTLVRPETTTTFIDRFLASAEAYRVPVVLAFNKMDDLSAEERVETEALIALYQNIGYHCYLLSAAEGRGVDALLAEMQGKVTLLAGHSGVGKSTLLNHLVPGANVRTAEISAVHGSGMHTTTFSELFELPGGGSVIDIPGIKGFGTFDMEAEEVSHYFREFFETSAECRFSNCTHTQEPGCAVLEAIERGEIALSRYESYISMLGDKEEGKYRSAF